MSRIFFLPLPLCGVWHTLTSQLFTRLVVLPSLWIPRLESATSRLGNCLRNSHLSPPHVHCLLYCQLVVYCVRISIYLIIDDVASVSIRRIHRSNKYERTENHMTLDWPSRVRSCLRYFSDTIKTSRMINLGWVSKEAFISVFKQHVRCKHIVTLKIAKQTIVYEFWFDILLFLFTSTLICVKLCDSNKILNL